MWASSSFEADVIADGLRNSPLYKEWHMKDLIISQVNNKYLRMSLSAHLYDRLVVHNLLEKENSFQVEGQEERDPGSKPLILNGLNRFM